MNKTFEENLEQLEEIVSKLENGKLKLDESLENFQKGIELTNSCTKALDEAEKKIKMLIKADEEYTETDFNPEDK